LVAKASICWRRRVGAVEGVRWRWRRSFCSTPGWKDITPLEGERVGEEEEEDGGVDIGDTDEAVVGASPNIENGSSSSLDMFCSALSKRFAFWGGAPYESADAFRKLLSI